jgi:hypothetical protein
MWNTPPSTTCLNGNPHHPALLAGHGSTPAGAPPGVRAKVGNSNFSYTGLLLLIICKINKLLIHATEDQESFQEIGFG